MSTPTWREICKFTHVTYTLTHLLILSSTFANGTTNGEASRTDVWPLGSGPQEHEVGERT